jgi:hypothetical protein
VHNCFSSLDSLPTLANRKKPLKPSILCLSATTCQTRLLLLSQLDGMTETKKGHCHDSNSQKQLVKRTYRIHYYIHDAAQDGKRLSGVTAPRRRR